MSNISFSVCTTLLLSFNLKMDTLMGLGSGYFSAEVNIGVHVAA